MSRRLQTTLAAELVSAGMTLDPAVRESLTVQILARGAREFNSVSKDIGTAANFRLRCIRSLGTGSALSEFAIAGVPLSDPDRLVVMSLGAIAITMVSAFDSVLDGGGRVPDPFHRDMDPNWGAEIPPESAFVKGLIDLYFNRLEALPRRRPEIQSLIFEAIARMHAAELQSVAGSPIGRSAWWRKNVLPILLLGMPAWTLATSCTAQQVRRHIRWLCRMGQFFGWLDDCVDYADDLASGRANRLDARLARQSESQFARDVAGQACRVLSEWDALNPPSPARSYFAVIVWSWIENPAQPS